ncbi:MAG: hypothetical protein KME10_21245 [Plectolyngbya sp. WJT66-NPBG17]|nr:hypothetical protein [Plectolyngbya sp. WJT66-NPBG17]
MTFLRTLPDTLQQPAALAMLGSVGVHLILFATLPAFTSSTEPRPEAEVRRVRLLEPPQGSSAPQASRSQLGLPPVPNTPNSKIQLPPVGSGTSPLPNPLYTIPDLTQPIPIPSPPQNQISSQDRFNDLLRRLAARQKQIDQQQQATIKIPKNPPVKPSTEPTTNPSPNVEPADPKEVASTVSPQPPAGTIPATPTTPPSAPSTPQTSNDRLLAALRYNPDEVTQPGDVKPVQDFVQLITQRGINVDWSKDYIRVRQLQDPKLEKPIPELPYPLSFPLNKYQQHPVAVAVLVGKDGKPLPGTKPELIGSTGYQILNDKAIEIIQQQSNQPNTYPAIAEDRVRVYVYEFQFKAPNIGTASVPQQGT